MKISNLIVVLVLLTIGISAYFVYQNNEKDVWDFHPNGVYEHMGHFKTFEQDKADARNKILLIGAGVIVLLIIIYFSVSKQEDKTDPLKNLENLKNNSIITTEEYNTKVNDARNLKEKENREKEKRKIIVELDNLKSKGIINDAEYLEKVKLIQAKFGN